jgi:hypothetical protein
MPCESVYKYGNIRLTIFWLGCLIYWQTSRRFQKFQSPRIIKRSTTLRNSRIFPVQYSCNNLTASPEISSPHFLAQKQFCLQNARSTGMSSRLSFNEGTFIKITASL